MHRDRTSAQRKPLLLRKECVESQRRAVHKVHDVEPARPAAACRGRAGDFTSGEISVVVVVVAGAGAAAADAAAGTGRRWRLAEPLKHCMREQRLARRNGACTRVARAVACRSLRRDAAAWRRYPAHSHRRVGGQPAR